MDQSPSRQEREVAKAAALRKKFQPHSFKVEGISALERYKLILEENLCAGDIVEVFMLTDGRFMLSKIEQSEEGSLIVEQVNTSYIYFEEELNIKEV